MVDSLKRYQVSSVPNWMKTAKFKGYIESMMKVLMDPNTLQNLPVDTLDGYANRFDLTGFLLDKNIPVSFHYTIMRMNGMDSVQDFNESFRMLYTPNPDVFSQLMSIYETSLDQ